MSSPAAPFLTEALAKATCSRAAPSHKEAIASEVSESQGDGLLVSGTVLAAMGSLAVRLWLWRLWRLWSLGFELRRPACGGLRHGIRKFWGGTSGSCLDFHTNVCSFLMFASSGIALFWRVACGLPGVGPGSDGIHSDVGVARRAEPRKP